MKYIITENRLHNIISRYLEEKDFVDKVYFNENDRLEIYVLNGHRIESFNLMYEIRTLFDFTGTISFFRPSKTEGYYFMFARY